MTEIRSEWKVTSQKQSRSDFMVAATVRYREPQMPMCCHGGLGGGDHQGVQTAFVVPSGSEVNPLRALRRLSITAPGK